MRVLILLPLGFPYGSAAASRVDKYARGLREAGAEAYVVGASFDGEPAPPGQWLRTPQGVPFRVARLVARPGTHRSLETYRQARPEFLDVLRNTLNWDAAILYGQSAYLYGPILRMCRRRGTTALVECNEWFPFWGFAGGFFSPFFWDRYAFRRWCLRQATGAIAISVFWEQYIRRLGLPVIRIPALGEDDVPAGDEAGRQGSFDVCCLGALYARDLPMTLLDSVRKAAQRGLPVRLVLIGDTAKYSYGRRARAAAQADPVLRERVEFRGPVPQWEVPEKLAPFKALVLIRPQNRETRACFPTRLPEYLHTGKPVILSAAGDVPLYFRHRVNAWLVPPGRQPGPLAEAYEELSRNAELARAIGKAGKETARREFSYRRHGKELLAFLNQLRSPEGAGAPRDPVAGAVPSAKS
jgi:glycosyltransferase involved in cell wall biosynthesis